MIPMLVFAVLAFAVVTFFVSFLIGRTNDLDKGKMATYVTVVAWGSLFCGLYLGKSVL
jgi:tetrahydromethanopterin S-methyltransferase subunit F